MGAMASQITSQSIVCSTAYSGYGESNIKTSHDCVLMRRIHQWLTDCPHKWPCCHIISSISYIILVSCYLIYIATVQCKVYANYKVHNWPTDVFVCLHNTAYRYHHYADCLKTLKTSKVCQVYPVECASKTKCILWMIFYAIYRPVRYQHTHFPSMTENICTSFYCCH